MSVLASYQGPWKGIAVNMPEILIDRAASPFVQNFTLKNGEIRTRQKYDVVLPGLPDGTAIRAIVGFLDANYIWHTCAIGPLGLWQLSGNASNQGWNQIAGFSNAGTLSDIYPIARFINKLFFSIGTNFLYSWNGISNQINIETAVAGGLYLAELNAQILIAYTIESSGGTLQTFPQRLRWGASGFTNQFDPASNVGAGFNDMLDCPDVLTGIMTVGRVGYVFRHNGITELTPTGQGTNPFEFNHLWASDKGTGNVFPRTAASYGQMGMFTAEEDIYMINAGSLSTCGKQARDAIYSDLADASDIVIGSITTKRTPKYISPAYDLFIPVPEGCIWWQFLIEEQAWQRPIFTRFKPMGEMEYVPTV